MSAEQHDSILTLTVSAGAGFFTFLKLSSLQFVIPICNKPFEVVQVVEYHPCDVFVQSKVSEHRKHHDASLPWQLLDLSITFQK